MNATGFWREAGIALVLSAAGAVAFGALSPLVGGAPALRFVSLALGSAYLASLLLASQERVGRAVVLAASSATALLLVLWNPPWWCWVLSQAGLIWLVRSLYRYDSLFAALADAVLGLFALATACVAMQRSQSLFLALWSYFLVQTLFVLIPRSMQAASREAPVDGFTEALGVAESALRRSHH